MTDGRAHPGGGIGPAAGDTGSAAPRPAGGPAPRAHNWPRSVPDLARVVPGADSIFGLTRDQPAIDYLFLAPFILLSSVVLARALGPAGRGEFAVMAAIAGAGVALGRVALPVPNHFLEVERRDRLRPLLGLILVCALGLGSVLLTGVRLLAWLAPATRSPGWERQVWLVAAWIPVGLLLVLEQEFLLRLRQDRRHIDLGAWQVVGTLALMCGLLLVGARTPESFFLARLVVTALVAVAAWRWSIQLAGGAPLLPSAALLRRALATAAGRAHGAALCVYALMHFDLLLVAYLRGPAEAGSYAIAAGMARAGVVVAAIVASVLNGLSEYDHSKETLREMAVALAPALVVLALLARPSVTLLYGRAFLPAIPALLWLLPGMYVLGSATAVTQSLGSEVSAVQLLFALAAAAALNIGLDLWLIPRAGIVGAAQASSLTYALLALVGIGYYLRRKR